MLAWANECKSSPFPHNIIELLLENLADLTEYLRVIWLISFTIYLFLMIILRGWGYSTDILVLLERVEDFSLAC